MPRRNELNEKLQREGKPKDRSQPRHQSKCPCVIQRTNRRVAKKALKAASEQTPYNSGEGDMDYSNAILGNIAPSTGGAGMAMTGQQRKRDINGARGGEATLMGGDGQSH